MRKASRRLPGPAYWQSLGLVALVSLLGLPLRSYLTPANLVTLYLLAEVIAAARFGLGPSIVAALASVLAFNFFFAPPRYNFAVEDAEFVLSFAGLLVVGLVISTLVARVRKQGVAAVRREAQTAALSEFSHTLAATAGLEAISRAIVRHIDRVFGREVVILLREGNELATYPASPGLTLDEAERAAAERSCRQGQPAGRGTASPAGARWRYHPLKTARGVIGVLAVKPPESGEPLPPEQFRLLETFASQAAVAIERAQLADAARRAQLLQETERLQTALLNSVSHDLRTPLAAISGALSALRERDTRLDETARAELIDNAWEQAGRMNRLVANLLDMTRLEAGALRVSLKPCDVQDLLGVALAELADKLRDRPVTVRIPPDLPLVPLDFVLITHVLVNLLGNAHKYSPPGSPIEVRARRAGDRVEIEVADRGLGIPADALARVFDKFYRVPRPDGAGGTGLGLSICKGIVEAHGGRIWAGPHQGGGTVVTLALPLTNEAEADE